MQSDDYQPQVIANRTQRRASVGFALFVALEAWVLFQDHSFGGYVFFAAGLIFFLFLAVRSWNSRIELDDEGLTSRSELRARRLMWSDVSGFEYRGPWRGLGATRNDGKFVRLQGYPPDRKSDAREVAARLEQERVRRRRSEAA
jgi:hypothetical protein